MRLELIDGFAGFAFRSSKIVGGVRGRRNLGTRNAHDLARVAKREFNAGDKVPA